LALTTHIIASVGWLGAVGAFLALAISGMTSESGPTVRAAYLAMELTGWRVIVPLCLASFLTGLIQALGTPWGLFRHYWVVTKLVIAIGATVLLMVHMQPVAEVARAAGQRLLAPADLHGIRVQLVFDAGAAIVALLVATTLSIFKPRGLTRYGWRKQRAERTMSEA
jgi:hypothetical protein